MSIAAMRSPPSARVMNPTVRQRPGGSPGDARRREVDVPEPQGAGDAVDVLEADRLAGSLLALHPRSCCRAHLGSKDLGRHEREDLFARVEVERVEHPVVRPDPDHRLAVDVVHLESRMVVVERSLPEQDGRGDDRGDGVDERPEPHISGVTASVVASDEVDHFRRGRVRRQDRRQGRLDNLEGRYGARVDLDEEHS